MDNETERSFGEESNRFSAAVGRARSGIAQGCHRH